LLPGSLEKLFLQVITPPGRWQDALRSSLNRVIGNDASSWNRLDEELVIRGIGAPGRIAFGCGSGYVVWDTSGSMVEFMPHILGETANILSDLNPRRLTLIQADAAVHEVRELSSPDELREVQVKGMGGTDFRPAFEEIDKGGETPDFVIFFTDTAGTFPDNAPDYPVIFGVIDAPRMRSYFTPSIPWGERVDIDPTQT
jgi:hypothetical protein